MHLGEMHAKTYSTIPLGVAELTDVLAGTPAPSLCVIGLLGCGRFPELPIFPMCFVYNVMCRRPLEH